MTNEVNSRPAVDPEVRWPPDVVARLVEAWGVEGLTASKIAAELGKTKNAVLGKLHRLGLLAKTEKFRAPAHKRDAILSLRVDQCRFPFGDVGDAYFHFCDATALDDSAYCAPHDARCHVMAAPITKQTLMWTDAQKAAARQSVLNRKRRAA